MITLEQNYRSTQTILDAADKLISANSQRIERELFTDNGDGVPIVVSEGYDEAEEAQMFLAEMGLDEAGLDRLIRAGYDLPHLETYFTVGPKEARAWAIRQGTLAPQAAGVIHGDFERGFIRAETIAYDDYVEYQGEAGAREHGRLRQEGKEYLVQDGDVMLFKFNV